MRPVQLAQVAGWCQGVLVGADRSVQAIDIDSRTVRAGGLFVALAGERHDGHDHAAAAIEAGAVALLVSRQLPLDAPQVVVGDTQLALGRLAAGIAANRSTRVLALTGSNGKTTVKTLLQSILEGAFPGRVHANPGNRNNEIGLPLALIEQPEDATIGIYEMGAGQPGDIGYLTAIARPHVALVNNIGPAHLERMGSLLGIAETKGAIYSALHEGGTAVVNADDAFAPLFESWASHARILRFAIDASAEIVAEDIRVVGAGSRFTLVTPQGSAAVELPLAGRHNVSNALAACAMAMAAGATLPQVVDGLQRVAPVPGRQVRHQLASGATLIDDSYNANPASVGAAIATLAAQRSPGREAWLVLGDMKELGSDAERLHAEVGARASAAGIDRLFTVGPLSAAASRAFGTGAQHFDDQDGLVAALRAGLCSRPLCLVKGSRSSAMDRVVAALRDAPAAQQDAGRDSHAA